MCHCNEFGELGFMYYNVDSFQLTCDSIEVAFVKEVRNLLFL